MPQKKQMYKCICRQKKHLGLLITLVIRRDRKNSYVTIDQKLL